MPAGPLQGRRVIELGTMIAAPFAAHILAELGAEVIKVEPPSGDPTRVLVRGGPSGSFIAYSHGKQSVCMDLADPAARAAFDRLLATADIVVHNLAPKSARRLKVTYEDCEAVRPGIVYCHIRGYGAGPQADDLASNPVAEASSGVMEGNRINGRPSRLGPSHHDQFAGSYAVIGILSALLQQAPSARTHKIEVGLYEVGLHVAARDLAGVQLKTHLLGRPEREPNGEFAMPGYGAYETADQRWIYLLMLNDSHWLKFCQAMELAEADDDTLRKLRDRKRQRDRVEDTVRRAVASMTFEQIAARLNAAGLGNTEVLPLDRVLDTPQARAPGKLETLQFRGLPFEVPAFPPVQPVAQATTPPRELGHDTLALLRAAGVTEEECQRLLAGGAIGVADPDAFPWAPTRAVEKT
jgi:crotonobetainyl-CoA:carnitine CoA-transferase CaiB-like acyl-CoA transferase